MGDYPPPYSPGVPNAGAPPPIYSPTQPNMSPPPMYSSQGYPGPQYLPGTAVNPQYGSNVPNPPFSNQQYGLPSTQPNYPLNNQQQYGFPANQQYGFTVNQEYGLPQPQQQHGNSQMGHQASLYPSCLGISDDPLPPKGDYASGNSGGPVGLVPTRPAPPRPAPPAAAEFGMRCYTDRGETCDQCETLMLFNIYAYKFILQLRIQISFFEYN